MIDLMARSSHDKLNSDVSTWLGLGSSSKFYPPSPSMWYEPEKMIVGTNSDLSQIPAFVVASASGASFVATAGIIFEAQGLMDFFQSWQGKMG